MLNKVMIIGRLGSDPTIKTIAGGQSVARLSVATSEKWTDRDGQKQEKTTWHNIVAWGKLADNCAKFLSKGSLAFFEGKLTTRSWETDSGEKRYATEVVASVFRSLDSKGSQQHQPEASSGFDSHEEIPF